MQIEIIKYTQKNNTIDFGLFLNDFLCKLKLSHWYVKNFDAHKIIGNAYESLSILFDDFQEELIQVCDCGNYMFPIINYQNAKNLKNYNVFSTDEQIILDYIKIIAEFKNILNSSEFENFLISSKSGLNNKKDEIISILNKSLYLMNMVSIVK